jgi:5-methylcytosine-specific restriction protein A
MPLRETLQKILTDYPAAEREAFKGHALAAFIRDEADQEVKSGLGELGAGLFVEGSPGQGNWAAVPWVSIFDPVVTSSATRGYYVVYLFHASKPEVYLSLNQGTTAVREEFGVRTREILKDRANLMRKRIEEFAAALPVKVIELGSADRLPGDYVAGHSLGVSYMLDALPNEASLRADLQTIVRAYRALTYRGGVDADIETQTDLVEEFGIPHSTSVIETRKYAYHRKIERNRIAARHAKKFHGTRCQACNLDFVERYGEIGKGFIEAHHLKAISTLEEGVAVQYEIATDFAVLCSNCHRMIHRTADPSDLAEFRTVVQAKL